MSEKEILETLEDIFELEDGNLEMETVLDELDEWDSLSKLSLMAVAKKQFEKSLTTAEIKGFETVADIVNYLK